MFRIIRIISKMTILTFGLLHLGRMSVLDSITAPKTLMSG